MRRCTPGTRRRDLFVHPTLYEGSSLVTLEAMAHGLAVVATRAGGLPDKVVPGETGWLVEPGSEEALGGAVADALQHPTGLRAAGRRRTGAGRAASSRGRPSPTAPWRSIGCCASDDHYRFTTPRIDGTRDRSRMARGQRHAGLDDEPPPGPRRGCAAAVLVARPRHPVLDWRRRARDRGAGRRHDEDRRLQPAVLRLPRLHLLHAPARGGGALHARRAGRAVDVARPGRPDGLLPVGARPLRALRHLHGLRALPGRFALGRPACPARRGPARRDADARARVALRADRRARDVLRHAHLPAVADRAREGDAAGVRLGGRGGGPRHRQQVQRRRRPARCP